VNELELIHRLKDIKTAGLCSQVIGDDCVEIAPRLLATTDMLMDQIHFDTSTTALACIARKVICVNLSDLAASGAVPSSILVSVALPKSWSTETALAFHRHMAEAAAQYGCAIIGGDTNVWQGPLVVNIVATGKMHWRGQIPRNGAAPGDSLFVTGKLGGSLLSGRHLTFTPRTQESQWLLDHVSVHAMMDLSDGLASDARRMAQASNVDFILRQEAIPIHSDVQGSPPERLDHALCDGDDFELLFAVKPDVAGYLQTHWPWPIPLTAVGDVVAGDGTLWLKDATGVAKLTRQGFVHQ
jgi:thiamine-monophosphate kinase